MQPVNNCQLSGRVGADAEVRRIGDWTPDALVVFPLYVTRRGKDGDEWVDKNTTVYQVSLRDRFAADLAPQIVKGAEVAVTGSVELQEYTASDGSPRRNLKLFARQVGLLVRPPRDAQPHPPQNPPQSQASQSAWNQTPSVGFHDIDTPF